ncbi:unnamed protein product [Urochloa humidicola]
MAGAAASAGQRAVLSRGRRAASASAHFSSNAAEQQQPLLRSPLRTPFAPLLFLLGHLPLPPRRPPSRARRARTTHRGEGAGPPRTWSSGGAILSRSWPAAGSNPAGGGPGSSLTGPRARAQRRSRWPARPYAGGVSSPGAEEEETAEISSSGRCSAGLLSSGSSSHTV